ncbi:MULTISPECIES: helix-turn-helix domain-containing protein [unclassified Methylobacterium]|uniref:helix-turn-helix domain-containing protein n=1 Tax=unclassified Methylobacterium TaxID=2615210 RepID=UPI0037A6FA7B
MRRIRTEKGLTQDALADLCELDRTYVGSIERGQRNLTIDSLERLSNGLGVEPWQLVRRTIVER